MKLHSNLQAFYYAGPEVPEGIVITNYSCDLDDEVASRLALMVPERFSLKPFSTRERTQSEYSTTGQPADPPEEPTEEGSE